jgi:hypothetical protein
MLERADSAQSDPWQPARKAEESASYGAVRAQLTLRSGDQDGAQQLGEDALLVADRTQQEWQRADVRRWLSVVCRPTADHDLEGLDSLVRGITCCRMCVPATRASVPARRG